MNWFAQQVFLEHPPRPGNDNGQYLTHLYVLLRPLVFFLLEEFNGNLRQLAGIRGCIVRMTGPGDFIDFGVQGFHIFFDPGIQPGIEFFDSGVVPIQLSRQLAPGLDSFMLLCTSKVTDSPGCLFSHVRCPPDEIISHDGPCLLNIPDAL